MSGDLPSLEVVRGLIASMKPPLAARVVELRDGDGSVEFPPARGVDDPGGD